MAPLRIKKKKKKGEDAPNNTINRTYLSRKADNSTWGKDYLLTACK